MEGGGREGGRGVRDRVGKREGGRERERERERGNVLCLPAIGLSHIKVHNTAIMDSTGLQIMH